MDINHHYIWETVPEPNTVDRISVWDCDFCRNWWSLSLVSNYNLSVVALNWMCFMDVCRSMCSYIRHVLCSWIEIGDVKLLDVVICGVHDLASIWKSVFSELWSKLSGSSYVNPVQNACIKLRFCWVNLICTQYQLKLRYLIWFQNMPTVWIVSENLITWWVNRGNSWQIGWQWTAIQVKEKQIVRIRIP